MMQIQNTKFGQLVYYLLILPITRIQKVRERETSCLKSDVSIQRFLKIVIPAKTEFKKFDAKTIFFIKMGKRKFVFFVIERNICCYIHRL